MKRRRLDAEMVSRGLAASGEEAGRLLAEQVVLVDGAPGFGPGTQVRVGADIRLAPASPFVSRGGQKLAGALEDLGLVVGGKRCLDAGAGSGGFTDCLLRCGAAHVVAVDVGYGQFHWSLRSDPRVTLVERTNIRTADPGLLSPPFDLVVADLSFISLRAVLDVLIRAADPGGEMLLLVKPQFEAPAGQVGPKGVVRDPKVWSEAVKSVGGALAARAWPVHAVAVSRVAGARGNREFFLLSRPASRSPIGVELKEAAASRG